MTQVDCLQISNFAAISDLRFLRKLKTITGKTWTFNEVKGSEGMIEIDDRNMKKRFKIEIGECKNSTSGGSKDRISKLSIKNNPNLQNLFGSIHSNKTYTNVSPKVKLMQSLGKKQNFSQNLKINWPRKLFHPFYLFECFIFIKNSYGRKYSNIIQGTS